MVKFDLNLEEAQRVCTNITLVSVTKNAWFEIEESKKRIHGGKNLINFNNNSEKQKGNVSMEDVSEEREKIEEAINILQSLEKRDKFYSKVSDSLVFITNKLHHLQPIPELRYPLMEKTCMEMAIEHYNQTDAFDLKPESELHTLGDVCLENAKRFVSEFLRERVLNFISTCSKSLEEITDNDELLAAIKKKKELEYFKTPIALVNKAEVSKILSPQEYSKYEVVEEPLKFKKVCFQFCNAIMEVYDGGYEEDIEVEEIMEDKYKMDIDMTVDMFETFQSVVRNYDADKIAEAMEKEVHESLSTEVEGPAESTLVEEVDTTAAATPVENITEEKKMDDNNNDLSRLINEISSDYQSGKILDALNFEDITPVEEAVKDTAPVEDTSKSLFSFIPLDDSFLIEDADITAAATPLEEVIEDAAPVEKADTNVADTTPVEEAVKDTPPVENTTAVTSPIEEVIEETDTAPLKEADTNIADTTPVEDATASPVEADTTAATTLVENTTPVEEELTPNKDCTATVEIDGSKVRINENGYVSIEDFNAAASFLGPMGTQRWIDYTTPFVDVHRRNELKLKEIASQLGIPFITTNHSEEAVIFVDAEDYGWAHPVMAARMLLQQNQKIYFIFDNNASSVWHASLSNPGEKKMKAKYADAIEKFHRSCSNYGIPKEFIDIMIEYGFKDLENYDYIYNVFGKR